MSDMSIFSDATDAAARVTRLTWFMIVLAAVVYAAVMAVMVVAMRRNRERDAGRVDLSDRGNRWVVVGGLIMPAIVLAAVLVAALGTMGRERNPRPALTIHVTGHQWWWEARYEFADLPDRFDTANEIHVPVGVPVQLELTTNDVIHSFWVPQLQGKIDLIPGDTNQLRLVAKRAGTYRGVCSEFCGAEHAKMGMVVVGRIQPPSGNGQGRSSATRRSRPTVSRPRESGCSSPHRARYATRYAAHRRRRPSGRT